MHSLLARARAVQAKAAVTVYKSILENGTQEKVVPLMQTRNELYE